MLAHLRSLTWRFKADGHTIWAVAPYAEPRQRADGKIVYRHRHAAETGHEGLACVDDAARAALLALALVEQQGQMPAESSGWAHADGPSLAERLPAGARTALQWAERWLTFVRYMQLPDGRFANFVLDRSGQRNLTGPTSLPGGVWWTGRALWALARYLRLTGNYWALDAWVHCPLPDLDDAGKTLGLFALAGAELLRAEPASLPADQRDALLAQQERARALVMRCSEAIVASGPDYFREFPGVVGLQLWGYHQLHAVACAAMLLDRPDWLAPCADTVRHLVDPVVAGRGLYRFDPATGGTKDGLCAYCLSPLVQGLGAMYMANGDAHCRELALEAVEWLYGRNDVGVPLYSPVTGRCRDGLSGPAGTLMSENFGAESSIEAGFMELERRRLLAVRLPGEAAM
jgi:hypothetical protein